MDIRQERNDSTEGLEEGIIFTTTHGVSSQPTVVFEICRFKAPSQNCVKRLLASCLSVCLSVSVHVEQLCSPLTDFHKIWYLNTFIKSFEKVQLLLKSDKTDGTLREDQYTFIIVSRSVFS